VEKEVRTLRNLKQAQQQLILERIAERATARIKSVVFDRNGFYIHAG
jgi:ribosomal protein L18